jgi:hypothetical protein
MLFLPFFIISTFCFCVASMVYIFREHKEGPAGGAGCDATIHKSDRNRRDGVNH